VGDREEGKGMRLRIRDRGEREGRGIGAKTWEEIGAGSGP